MPGCETHATSILGEALHAGFGRLTALLRKEFDDAEPLIGGKVAASLGFNSWDELCEEALGATSRRLDPRLAPLVDGDLHDHLVDRLASGFETSGATMRRVLLEFRDPTRVLVAALSCQPSRP